MLYCQRCDHAESDNDGKNEFVISIVGSLLPDAVKDAAELHVTKATTADLGGGGGGTPHFHNLST